MVELKEIKEIIEKKNIKFLSLQFVDIAGTPKSCEVPAKEIERVSEGIWFDGSSIEGFVRIYESDMYLLPDLDTFKIIPWRENTARIICDVYRPDGKPFEGDPRGNLKRVLEEAKKEEYEFYVGPELEFFLFKDNGEKFLPHDHAGYFDLAPADEAQAVRQEVVDALERMGISVEMLHHEVAQGQHEIDFRYDCALKTADNVITYKLAVKTIAKRNGLWASFMPKPVKGINGSGMHTHQSLWKNGENIFYGKESHGLSKEALWFIGGQLKHARAMTGVLNPTINSYKRLIPGFEAPVYICWGRKNRSALIRVPEVKKKKATRAEIRSPDPSANPYLAFAVMLKAGMDGIKKRIDPPEAVEEDVYGFDDRKLREFYIATLPKNLEEAMEEMEKDPVIKDALGGCYERLKRLQRRDIIEYQLQISDWERIRYKDV